MKRLRGKHKTLTSLQQEECCHSYEALKLAKKNTTKNVRLYAFSQHVI